LTVNAITTALKRGLRVLESVSCLECGSVYAKPVGGGTAATNPGCPECGYLGWMPFKSASERVPLRSGVDRRQTLSAQLR
jgi:predicted  nucleic acid-binding Zn-ribbon protein